MMHIGKAKDHRHRGIRDQIFGEVIKILTDQDEADTKFANFTRHSVHDVLVIGRHKLMRLDDDNEGVGIVALAARLRLEKQALEQTFRSTARRVGKECGSRCRSRWTSYNKTKKTIRKKKST